MPPPPMPNGRLSEETIFTKYQELVDQPRTTETADAGVTAHPHSAGVDLETERYIVVKKRSTSNDVLISRQPTRIVPGCTSPLANGNGGARIGDMSIQNARPLCFAGIRVVAGAPIRQHPPRIADFSILNSAPPLTQQGRPMSPMVVTPTDAKPCDPMPTAQVTNILSGIGYGHKSNFPSDADINQHDVPRYIYGRLRRYNESEGKYGNWEPLIAYDPDRAGVAGLYTDEPCEVHLKRGGMIRYFPKIVSEERRATLAQKCRAFQEYRQYKFGPGGLANEPRVHVLLSSKAAAPMTGDYASTIEAAPGYKYHGIKMQAQPLSSEPVFEALSAELAAVYEFPNQEWNIGCDAIVYRNGNDNIGWHSDDTQGESKVMCIVPESPGISRPVHIRPKRNAKKILTDGDEEIQLFVRQGDGYEMDGLMQSGYDHCLPKVKKVSGLRSALIFRQGTIASVRDSGNRIADNLNTHDILAPPAALPIIVGHPPSSSRIIEGKDSYSRADLFTTRVHRCDRRGVCGNIENGAESIVVSRQDEALREEDGLQWLKYTSSRRQGGGGFATSYKKYQPIRVFRSSSLNNMYAPPPRPGGYTSYRYDGLYRVMFIWDEHGNRVHEGPPPNGAQYTFYLERLPKIEATREDQPRNYLSTEALWIRICDRKGPPATPFVPARPTTLLGSLPLLPSVCRSDKKTAANDDSQSMYRKTPQKEKMVPVTEAAPVNSSIETPAEDLAKNAEIEIKWVQCDQCNKWRILALGADMPTSKNDWLCEMNIHDPFRNTCDAPEQTEEEYMQSLEDASDSYDDDEYKPSLDEINSIMTEQARLTSRKTHPAYRQTRLRSPSKSGEAEAVKRKEIDTENPNVATNNESKSASRRPKAKKRK